MKKHRHSFKKEQDYTVAQAIKIFEGVIPAVMEDVKELKSMYHHSDLAFIHCSDALGAILLGCRVILDGIEKERKDLSA